MNETSVITFERKQTRGGPSYLIVHNGNEQIQIELSDENQMNLIKIIVGGNVPKCLVPARKVVRK